MFLYLNVLNLSNEDINTYTYIYNYNNINDVENSKKKHKLLLYNNEMYTKIAKS